LPTDDGCSCEQHQNQRRAVPTTQSQGSRNEPKNGSNGGSSLSLIFPSSSLPGLLRQVDLWVPTRSTLASQLFLQIEQLLTHPILFRVVKESEDGLVKLEGKAANEPALVGTNPGVRQVRDPSVLNALGVTATGMTLVHSPTTGAQPQNMPQHDAVS